MKITDVFVKRTDDDKQAFSENGKNWFVVIKFENKKQFGVELKPEMNLTEIFIEIVKFANLLITKVSE